MIVNCIERLSSTNCVTSTVDHLIAAAQNICQWAQAWANQTCKGWRSIL